MWASRLVCLLMFWALAAAQPLLQFKKTGLPQSSRTTAKRMGNRRHLLIQFGTPARPQRLFDLTARGVTIVQYVPESAYIVSVPDGLAVADDAISLSMELAPENKLSADLADAPNSGDVPFALVEFYPDVDMNVARAIVVNAQLQIRENSDLLDHHLLVSGAPDSINGLAQWDEVAYIFPAADDLVQGLPLNSCAGALTAAGAIGQSIAKVGYGWDGPGLGGADLFYAFAKVTAKIESSAAKAEIVRAFNEWAKYAKLTFTPSDNITGSRTLTVLFGSGQHGDAYPFDGPNGVLAHTFYPYPTNAEPIAGDLHFDDDENWKVGADIDLFSVALHETGHALGLGHSDKPGAVMYPYYRKATTLTQEDIGAILTVYAPQTGTGPASTPTLSLTVQDPGTLTTASSIALSGSASGGVAPLQVSWAVARGPSGIAVGSSAWTIAGIPLASGPNQITLTVTDSSQATVHQTLTISRTQDLAQRSLPMLAIVSPVSSVYVASSAALSISGTASDTSGISRVAWSTSAGAAGQASGTLNWAVGNLMLPSGTTIITVTAYALSGLSASQTLHVTYNPQAAPPPSAPPTTPPPTSPGPDTAPPTLAIVSPALSTVTTSSGFIAISGTAKDNVGVTSVYWSTSNGDTGVADGTYSWKIAAIPLLVGTNTVTIAARDAAGNSSWRSVVVTRH